MKKEKLLKELGPGIADFLLIYFILYVIWTVSCLFIFYFSYYRPDYNI